MEQARLILAVVLSTFILLIWQYFFAAPVNHHNAVVHADSIQSEFAKQLEPAQPLSRNEAIQKDKRISFENEYVKGSINLQGAKIDDLVLRHYQKEQHSDDKVTLLSPKTGQNSYFAEFGWLQSGANTIDLPNSKTNWQAIKKDGKMLLSWLNNQNIRFNIEFQLDDRYMFNILQSVENLSPNAIEVYPYATIQRSYGSPETNAIVHEGAIGALNDKLVEYSFEDLRSEAVEKKQQNGWIGFSDKYWLASLIPTSNVSFNAKFLSHNAGGQQLYQAQMLKNKMVVGPGQRTLDTTQFFAGAKNLDLLHKYQDAYNIKLFDRAVDFGILYFITKPIFMMLNYFYHIAGNFGIAILLLTICIKMLLFPLAYKGFVSMNKLKVLQPQLAAIKERFGDDAMAFQKEVMAMYKKEKVNPVSGCLPILLQMPIFFALYKVLSVTIEMRHAEFIMWLTDLSVQDPTSLFNLFGLLPWTVPSFLMIGVLPIFMAITMFIQQNLNPAPSDPIQAQVMKFLPLIFLFVFASFPSGLVLYWTWSNILSIAQQIFIKRLVR